MYAGFWKRFGAFALDSLILFAITFVISFIFGFVLAAGGASEDFLTGVSILLNLVSGVLGMLYFVIMESSSRQATIGKLALGIKVTTLDGEQISFWRAMGRYWAKFISALILLVGYFMVGFTEKKQGLHDMMAGCLVVNKSAATVPAA